MPRLALFLLGPPRLELDGEPVHIGRRKAVALLAYLAVTGGSHSRDSLATLLWPEYDQSGARADLRRTLSVLNRALGSEWLTADRETAGLNPDAGLWLDVDQFRRLLSAWQDHAHPEAGVCSECLDALAEAVELYRGDFLAGFTLRDSAAFDEFQFFETQGLRDELASALERLVRYCSAQGEHELAIGYARRWLALDPLHEPAHRCLMELYAQAGQRAAALRQYQECARILEQELGLPPSQETTSLHEQIRTRPAGREEPLVAAPRPRHNLPVQLTPFVGREAVLAEIADRLEDPDCRLLTLVGLGGSGKTRLALEAAAAQLDNFEHGVYFVSLAPLGSVDSIVPTVAEALGFSFYEGGTPEQQLLDYLRQKRMLILMDNFEHLLDGVGLVSDVLRTGSGVKVLATSRARLNVQGEHLLPVPGMHVPDWAEAQAVSRYGAVQLFLQSARRALPGFELTDDDSTHVIQICRLVEGMPLGILLAAAWVGMLTPAEIVAEIREGLDFLETDLRDVPRRQRSMRAVFDHSWNLLTPRQRSVMQALSVFRGGFTWQAARRVAGATLHELRALVDRSLLQRDLAGRYEIHELLRQYAAEKLAHSPTVRRAVRDRHSAYYTAALQQWDVELKGPRQQAALAEIEADGENARAAWNWAIEWGQVEWLDRAMEGLCRSYEWRGRYQEGEAACRMAAEKLLATMPEGGLRVRAKSLAWQGVFNGLLGRTEPARQLLGQSLVLLEGPESGDRVSPSHQEPVPSAGPRARVGLRPTSQGARSEKAFVLLQMGRVVAESNREEARQYCEQSLALYRGLGDRWGTANALGMLGGLNRLLGAQDEARQLFEESLAIRRALGDHIGIADSLLELGWAAVLQGQLEEGERLIRESVAIRQEIGGRARVAQGVLRLGVALFWLGRLAEAHSLLEESVAVHDDLGERSGLAWSNNLLGLTRAHLGQYEDARAQAQVALALYREIDQRPGVGHALLVLGHVALATEAYAEAQQRLQECVALYRETGVLEEQGWALGDLALAARGLGDLCQARRHLSEALRLSTETPVIFALWVVLPAIALLLADQAEVERAVEVYALASHQSLLSNSRWFEDVFGRHIAAVAAALPSDVVAVAQERGRARDLQATVAELLVELGE